MIFLTVKKKMVNVFCFLSGEKCLCVTNALKFNGMSAVNMREKERGRKLRKDV